MIDTAPVSDAAVERSTTRGVDDVNDRIVRILFRLAALLTVLPITVAAVRNGLDNWMPTWDAATTTFRVNDVFTRHPPLMGMWSSASHWSGHQVNFIGALQLYVLAIPVKLLGNSWGVLLGMAAINTAVVLTTLWLIRRRVGYVSALVGCAFVASLVWSLGSEVLVDITPMQMGVLPFLLLLVAAWSVADGDVKVLPLLAFVANYLLLDHLTFVLIAPFITVSGLILLAVRLRSERSENPNAWKSRVRQLRRQFGWSAAITIVVWIPPLLQQFASKQPGNLTSLLQASSAKPPFSATWLGAASALSATIAVPPMWLRDSFAHPRFLPDGDGRPFVVGLLGMVVLLGLYVIAAAVARRRHDRTIGSAVAMGLVGIAVGFWTVKKSPGAYGLRGNYLHSLWTLAAFVWMVLGLALVANWPTLRRWWKGRATAVGAALLVTVLSILTLPRADLGAGTSAWSIPVARSMDAQIVPALRGKGPVLVRYSGRSGAWAMMANVLLSLQQANIPIRLRDIENARQYGFNRAFIESPPNARTALVVSTSPITPEGYTRIADAPVLTDAETADMHRLEGLVRAWLEKIGTPKSSKAFHARNDAMAGGVEYRLTQLRAQVASPGDLVTLDDFRQVAATQFDADPDHLVLDTTGIDPEVLRRWGKLTREDLERHVYVYIAPIERALDDGGSSAPVVDSGAP